MKKLLLFFTYLICISVNAQTLKSSSINNGGDRINDSISSFSYTIGQPIVGTISNNEFLRRGFQQPSHKVTIIGCTDSLACNYDYLASIDDSSCLYPDTSFTNVAACDSYTWGDSTYIQTGTYYSSQGSSNNNYSMKFDGVNDYITLNNNLGSVSEMSISIWVNIKSTSVGPKDIVGNWGPNGSGSSYLLSYEGASQEIAFICLGNSTAFTLDSSDFSSWINVSVTYDGNNISIYKNGVFMNSSLANGLIQQGSSIITIGTEENLNFCQSHWNNCSFEGMIDNFNVWNKSLTSLEIQNYMNCPPTGSESGLVGSWDFEEGSGSIVYDQTSNGNNGTVHGAQHDSNVPPQSCQLTTTSGCDSVAVLNLKINQPDTSYTNVTACDSYIWEDSSYTKSGTYYSNTGSNNNYSINFGTNCSQSGTSTSPNINFGDVLDMNSSFSFTAWYYANSSCAQHVSIASKKEINNGYQGWDIGFDNNDKKLRFGLSENYSSGHGNGIHEVVETNLIYDQWTHMSVVFDASNKLFLYINGQLQDSTSTSFLGLKDNSAPFLVGAHVNWSPYNSYEWSWKGNLDDVALWNKALSNEEIQQLVSCSPKGTENGLEGYWNFEEGSGNTVYDLTSNGNNGTINGAQYDSNVPPQSCQLTNISGCDSVSVLNLTINQSDTSFTNVTACDSYTWGDSTYTQSGIYTYNRIVSSNNYSINFDGNNSGIEVANNLSFSNQQGVSFQFWAKADWNQTPTGAQNEEVMINFGVVLGNGHEFRYLFTRSGNLLDARCEGNGFSSGGQADINVSNLILANNEWINIAGVYNFNGNIELYINGVNVSSGNFSLSNNYIGLTNGNRYIGNNAINRYFIGNMDNVALWSKSLTQKEIQQYMNCPPTGSESGLVGYWNFEEGSGSIVYDQTSNANNGTINGAQYDSNVPNQSCQLTSISGCDSVVVLNLTINQP
ncbi:MAG: LamG domain-containing protein, partial [Bacteroidota bacterium]|nr:LamG domain-containing protein [Bacteroidota bacterium]